jgi:gliding motility-associated lipoprotein GldB
MKLILRISPILMLALLMLSCNRNPLKINVSDITGQVKIVRFEQELKSLGEHPDLDQINNLREKHPEFTDVFSSYVIRIGTLDGEESVGDIRAFLTDTMITSLYRLVEEKFSDFKKIETELTQAFKHYSYYFPSKPLPTIYTCISGFNESAFVAEGVIGISLDKYLGAHTAYYPMLGFPRYKQRKMIPGMIPSDVMYVWAMGEFEAGENATTLLDHMVHEGKILYFMQAMMPSAHDSLLIGYTSGQVEWCKKNETQMWTYLIEKEMLYSTKQMDVVRYINDGPQTSGFPAESPGRTGAWLGWQIIRKYMKRNPEITLANLMANNNYQEILNASAYLP